MVDVILGDTHHPFANQAALEAAYKLIAMMKPDRVIQIGDLYDFYSFGRFPRNPNVISPQDEIDLGRAHAEDMWNEIQKAAPKAKCYQLAGNHDLRPLKLVMDKADCLVSFMKKFVKDQLTFKGVELVDDETIINGVVYQHGMSKLGDHAKYNQQSTVVGHSHKPGVVYFRNRQGLYWELNVGWLGDVNAEVFDYRARKKMHGMTNGIGAIDTLGPRFVEI